MKSDWKVLLTHSNLLQNDSKQQRKMQPYPPLATLQAASILKAEGYNVSMCDPTFHAGLEGFYEALNSIEPDLLIVYEDCFNFITKMCLGHMRKTALAMCRAARRSGAAAIVASSDTTNHPDRYLHDGADYVIVGEADKTAAEVCNALYKNIDPLEADVPGIAGVLPGGVIKINSARPLTQDLGSLPMPAWDMVEIEPYRQAWKERHGYFSLNMTASRGCPYSCNWCAKPIWGNHFARRPAGHVAAELAWVMEHLSPDHIWFADDVFGYSEGWVADFKTALQIEKAHVPYTIQSRADLLTPEAISNLRESGCIEVWLGAESGSQRVLDAMNKSVSPESLKKTVSDLKAAGIRPCLFIQFGYPGEALEDIFDTVDLVRETFPHKIGISVTYPLPGTPLYLSVRKTMGHQANWQDSDDLAMLFSGSYTTPFYKKLHSVLHAELDLMHRTANSNNNGSIEEKLWKEVMDGWMALGRMEASHRRKSAGRLKEV